MGDRGKKGKDKLNNQKIEKKTKENARIAAENLRVNTKDSKR